MRATFSFTTSVVYVPVGGHPLTATIPRGAAIVGKPALPCEEAITVNFVDGPEPFSAVFTLADRALCAGGRLQRGASRGRLVLPREALLVVGALDGDEGRITLTGPHSERAVADWLGQPQLARTELCETGRPPTGREVPRIEPAGPARLDPASFERLLERAGIQHAGEEWIAADGRRTPDAAEALIWALEVIAREG